MNKQWLTLTAPLWNSIVMKPDDEGEGTSDGDDAAAAADTSDVKDDTTADDKAADDTKEASADDDKADDKDVKGDDAEPVHDTVSLENLKLPEGMEVDDKIAGKFLDILNNAKLSPIERGQAFIDLQAESIAAASEQASELWNTTQQEWQEAVRNDSALGGGKLEGTLSEAAKVIDQFGNGAFRDMLDMTGAGNHVEMVRFLHNVAQIVNEGGPASGSPANSGRDPAETLYPNQGKAS